MIRAVYFFYLLLLLLPFSTDASVVRRSTGTFVMNSREIVDKEPGLVALWTFDGPDISPTTLTDRSGSSLSGTLNSFTVLKMTPGNKAQALTFDGVDDNISMGDVAESANITLAAWVKPAANKTGMKIVSKKMSGAASQYGLATHGSDSTKFTSVFFSSAPSSDVCDSTGTAGSYEPNKWYFVAATYDGDSCKIYVNGVDVTTVTSDIANGNILNTSSALRIGADGGAAIAANSYFAGAIDEVRIYNRVLTEAEIARIYRLSSGVSMNNSKNDRVTTGLVGLWSFDGPDMLSNVADRSGQGNHGFLLNITATSSSVTPGKMGQALKFDGVNDIVRFPNASIFNFGTSDFSIAFWVNPAAMNNTTVYLDQGSDSTNLISFELLSNGKVRVYLRDGSSNDIFIDSSNTISANSWYYIVFKKAGSVGTLYINGSSVGSDTDASIGNVNLSGGSQPTIGASGGKIDDLRIYNKALSTGEIQTLYNLGR